MPMALRKLPAAFDLGSVEKGTYPLLFNTPQNYNYIGPIPALDFYIFDEETRTVHKWKNGMNHCVQIPTMCSIIGKN